MASPPPPPPPKTWTQTYLTIYNTLSAIAWFLLLTLSLSALPLGPAFIKANVAPAATTLQTAAILDFIHSIFRIIPSRPFPTFTQVGTRVVQVALWRFFPDAAHSEVLGPLIVAWAAADSVRYAVLSARMLGVEARWAVWVRYSAFWVLYPVGIGGEWWIMFRVFREVESVWAKGVLGFLLGLYVPGAVFMFSHMVKQRRRALGKREVEKKE